MKYLNALLQDAENVLHSPTTPPTKPTKPVLSVLSGLQSKKLEKIEAPSWSCCHCGQSLTIDAIDSPHDQQEILTFERCNPCLTVDVTPSVVKQPPWRPDEKPWGIATAKANVRVCPIDRTEAEEWLTTQLTTPRRIATLIVEWTGSREYPTGQNIDALMSARWVLGVEAYVGQDNRFWWRLPQNPVH